MSRDDNSGPLIMMLLWIPVAIWFFIREFRRRTLVRRVERGEALQDLATVVGGEVARDPSFAGPFVRFHVDRIRAYYHERMLNQSQAVVISTIEARVGFPAYLQATSAKSARHPMRSSRFHTLPRLAGFDIVTTDLDWWSELQVAGLADLFADFRAEFPAGSRIQLAGDRLTLEIEDRLTAAQVRGLLPFLRRFFTLAVPLVDATGIQFEGEVTIVAKGLCPVCCQAFTQPGIPCDRCSAPHHADCWSYWGRCAIFGCNGGKAA